MIKKYYKDIDSFKDILLQFPPARTMVMDLDMMEEVNL